MIARPPRVLFVAGTGTGVGKTWVASGVLRGLRAGGACVSARKPAQSFDPAEVSTDADVLAGATGEAPHDVCPPQRWYARALAPPMAAIAVGAPAFTVGDLVAEIGWPDPVDVGLVEGAGGPRSPIAADGDNVTLACALAPDRVLLVADAGLGTINAVRLSVDAFAPAPVTVVLNHYDDDDAVHRANRHWLGHRDGFDVVVGADAVVDRMVP